jgi:hypothetical protein
MPWKPVTGQVVFARLDGQVRGVLVTAWHRYTGAVRVNWPPENRAVVSHDRFSRVRKTEIDNARYEPLDPDAFRAATQG